MQQITIPIKCRVKSETHVVGDGESDDDAGGHDHGGGHDHDVWDSKCDHELSPALQFWGRHDYFLEPHHPETYANLTLAVQLGHGDMHLDYWLDPEELIGSKATATTEDERKPVFEVTVNVSDYKPEELKVQLSEDRVLSIEGQHEHYDQERDDPDRRHHNHDFDSLYASFRRSVTLPTTVIERQIECQLSSDGQELVVTAPVRPTARVRGVVTRYHGWSQESQCPNINECTCMIAEDRRG